MSFSPLINAPLLIQVHVMFAVIALVTGPVAIHRKRRDRLHKYVGYTWVVAMLVVAFSALAIPAHDLRIIGQLGPLHVFSPLVIWSVFSGMRAIYRGDIAAHKAALQGLYWQGLALAGLFNFLPGRAVNRMLFADTPEAGFVVMVLGGAALIYVLARQSRWFARSVGV